jgi:hypothetical protein
MTRVDTKGSMENFLYGIGYTHPFVSRCGSPAFIDGSSHHRRMITIDRRLSRHGFDRT